MDSGYYRHTMCTGCGREVTWKNADKLSLSDINQDAKCCDDPRLFWILGNDWTRNKLHKDHVDKTRRNNVN